MLDAKYSGLKISFNKKFKIHHLKRQYVIRIVWKNPEGLDMEKIILQ
jgi:hypothetical protein